MATPAITTVALDMDGTLLTTDKRVTQRSRAALEALHRRGIVVVPVTGKAPRLTARCVAPLQLPMVCLDGAVWVVDGQSCWLPEAVLPLELATRFVAATELPLYLLHDGVTYVRGRIDEPQFADWSDRILPLRAAGALSRVTHLVVPHQQRAPLQELALRLTALAQRHADACPIRLFVTDSLFHGSYSLFVRSAACTKLLGARALGRALGFSLQEVMFLGDWVNDIPLLEAVGFPVAMRNAVPAVFEHVRAATLFTNDEDGAVRFLERYFDGGGAAPLQQVPV